MEGRFEHGADSVRYLRLMARYQRLLNISRQLNAMLEIGLLLGRIVSAASELTLTENASILLLDPGTGELRFEATTDSRIQEKFVVPLEGSIAGWVFTHGQPVLVDDGLNDPRIYRKIERTIQFSTRNMLAVPMQGHDRVIGVLEAVNKRDDALFDDEDLDTLAALSAQAAIAIENARLFQQNDKISELVHEIRAPLAALKASATLLKRPELPEESRMEVVDTMVRQTDRLDSLTSAFLDLARLESGRVTLDISSFNLHELINDALREVQGLAQQKGISLHTRFDREIDKVEADHEKIFRIVLNLLTNAVKYNAENGEIHVETRQMSQDKVRISVRDTGIGIPPESQSRIFEKFYRVPGTESVAKGTGLGLVIAQRIAQAHGGTMGLTSKVGEGSTFYFIIPISHVAGSITFDDSITISP